MTRGRFLGGSLLLALVVTLASLRSLSRYIVSDIGAESADAARKTVGAGHPTQAEDLTWDRYC